MPWYLMPYGWKGYQEPAEKQRQLWADCQVTAINTADSSLHYIEII